MADSLKRITINKLELISDNEIELTFSQTGRYKHDYDSITINPNHIPFDWDEKNYKHLPLEIYNLIKFRLQVNFPLSYIYVENWEDMNKQLTDFILGWKFNNKETIETSNKILEPLNRQLYKYRKTSEFDFYH